MSAWLVLRSWTQVLINHHHEETSTQKHMISNTPHVHENYFAVLYIECDVCSSPLCSTSLNDCALTYLTNHCLDHQHSLLSQALDKLINIDAFLCLDPLHHWVECDEGACPPNTSTAVNQEDVRLGIRMCLSHSLDEVDHGDGIAWQGLHDLAMQGSGTMWPEVEAYLARHSVCIIIIERKGFYCYTWKFLL